MRPHVQVFDFFNRRITFAPKKKGDVGHDLSVYIEGSDQNWFDMLMTQIIGTTCVVIWPWRVRNIQSGLHLVMGEEVWCEIRPRSSTSRKLLTIIGGTIDSGYRGPLFTVIHNMGYIPRIIKHGERYAQAVFHYAVRPQVEEIDKWEFYRIVTNETDGRGADGFGSTGQ